MKRILLVIAIVATVAGCAGAKRDVELPDNSGAGADEMKSSPCACRQLDYDGRGFKWVGA
ncbi:MAG: lipoprotein [Rhodospirillales bacterium]